MFNPVEILEELRESKRKIKKETFLNTLYDKDLDVYFFIKHLLQNEREYTSFVYLLNTLHSFKRMAQNFHDNYSNDTLKLNFLYRGLIKEFQELELDLWKLKDNSVNFGTEIKEGGRKRNAEIYFLLSENAYFYLTIRITHKKLTYINRFIFSDIIKIKNLHRRINVTLRSSRSLFFFKNLLEHAKNFPEELKEFEKKHLQKKILKDLALNLDNKEIYLKELNQKEKAEIPF
jgi:hypothetical protein